MLVKGLDRTATRQCAAKEALRVHDGDLTARKIEQILRDAGISKSVARAIVAGGWKAVGTDAAPDASALAAKLRSATAILKGHTPNE
jgi:hypothetical protein